MEETAITIIFGDYHSGQELGGDFPVSVSITHNVWFSDYKARGIP